MKSQKSTMNLEEPDAEPEPLVKPFIAGPFGRPFISDSFGKPITISRRTDHHQPSSGKYSVAEKKKTKVVDSKPDETEPEKNYNRPQSGKKYSAREKGKQKVGDAEPAKIFEQKLKEIPPPPSSGKYSVVEKKKTKVVDSKPDETEPEKNYNRPQSGKKYSAREKGKQKVGDAEPAKIFEQKLKEIPPPPSSGKYSVAEKKKTKVVDSNPEEIEPEKNYNRPQSGKKYSAREKGKQKVGDAEPAKTFDKKMKEIPPPPSSLMKSKNSGKPSITDPEKSRKVKPTFKWPPGIRESLYPHQIEGVKWLFSLHHKGKGGGLLCDDMGLGKTRQICSFVAGLFNSNSIRKVIIVSPTTTMDHWKTELSLVGLSKLTKMYSSKCKNIRESELQYVMQDKGIIVTTYDLISKKKNAFCNDCTWDYMFLDEGHLMKNPDTARVQNIKDITCLHRIIITGTPVQNNLKEFKTVLEFCLPQVFGEDNKLFEDIETMRGSQIGEEQQSASYAARELKSIVKPYILRRGKEVLPRKLPDKDEIIVWIPLSDRQEEHYKTVIKSEANSFMKIAALKKICNHTWLYDKLKADDMNKSCKMPFIMSLIDESTRHEHKVVLFSSSVEMLDIIEDLLAPLDLRLKRIDGNTSDSKRTKQIKAFQEGDGDVFLLTSGAGGVGITLTAADRVIIVDPGWNPSVDNQSADRVHRIGQEKAVIVHRLITCRTIEEDIYRKQIFKDELSRSITEEDSKKITFTKKEEKAILTLSQEGYQESPTQEELFNEQDLQRRSENLKTHVRFLKTLGISGVSFHDRVHA